MKQILFLIAPDKPPAQVTAVATDARIIYVSWSPVPVDGRNGDVIGYKVIRFMNSDIG